MCLIVPAGALIDVSTTGEKTMMPFTMTPPQQSREGFHGATLPLPGVRLREWGEAKKERVGEKEGKEEKRLKTASKSYLSLLACV